MTKQGEDTEPRSNTDNLSKRAMRTHNAILTLPIFTTIVKAQEYIGINEKRVVSQLAQPPHDLFCANHVQRNSFK